MSDFITVEGGDSIGRGGRGLQQRTDEIRANLQRLVADLEPSDKDWQGVSGSSFRNAKNVLFEKFDTIVVSLGSISAGLGKTQFEVNTADNESTSDVSSAESQTQSVLNRPITANI